MMHESGAAFGFPIKKPSVKLQSAVIDAAHKKGLKTVAHAIAYEDTLEILSAGVDGLTHTFVDHPPTKELIEAYKKNNACVYLSTILRDPARLTIVQPLQSDIGRAWESYH